MPTHKDARKKLSNPKLNINRKNIIAWSRKYDDRFKGTDAERMETRLKNVLQNQSYLDKPDFIELCMWKSPRPKKHYENNHPDLVKKITEISFGTKNEDERIKVLMELKGVSWPVASAILHFAFPDKYPILDFRVIWSLGWKDQTSYDIGYWKKYRRTILDIAKQVNLPIRIVDKALWEYSKQNQPARKKL